MNCNKCYSNQIISVTIPDPKCVIKIHEQQFTGHIPDDIGIGYGDDLIKFKYCGHCGTIQGNFPLNLSKYDPVKKQPQITQQVIDIPVPTIIDEIVEYSSDRNEFEVGKRLNELHNVMAPNDITILVDTLRQIIDLKTANCPTIELDEVIDYIKNTYKNNIVRHTSLVYI